jgi:hypothetical protein
MLAIASLASAADPPKPACALLKACGLTTEGLACTPEQSRPLAGVAYDARRCAEPRELVAKGVTSQTGIGASVFTFLGARYRVSYDISGEAPISEAKFDYLAQDLSLAAKLASRFSRTKYTIRYLDAQGPRFFAARSDKLTGEAELLFHDSALKQRVFFGSGVSKFGPWKLRGSAYVDIRVRPATSKASGVAYEVRIRTAPVNAMVNAIMRLGLFKGLVVGQIEDTMKDLVGAAAALSTQGVEGVLADPAFSPEERAKVQALAALPD